MYLAGRGTKSTTIRSYVSAIKVTLTDDNHIWNNELVLLNILIRACRSTNDVVRTKLPIQCKLLELILFEIDREFEMNNQHFLSVMYKTLFIISYYGLFRLGELTKSKNADHTLKARNVHLATNKDKTLLILYSWKTHSKESAPQRIKITGVPDKRESKKFFCPFHLIKQYLDLRGGYQNDKEHFFIFRDSSVVRDKNV